MASRKGHAAWPAQESPPHYPAGMALRFARVKRFRRDKSAAGADTLEMARAIFAASRG